MAASTPVGILTPSRQSLSVAQRQQYNLLRARGVDEETARALAQALVQKRVDRRSSLSEELASLKSAWDESQHPRAKDGEFGSGEGQQGSSEHDLSHRGRGFEKLSPKEHLEASGAAHAKALAAQKSGRDGEYKRQMAVAGKHLDAVQSQARASISQKLAQEPIRKAAQDPVMDLALAALELVEKKRTQPFEAKFVDQAKEKLPGHWYDLVHAGARAATGGQESGRARRENKSLETRRQALTARAEQLQAQMAAWEADNAALEADEQLDLADVALKSLMPADTIHVDRPFTGARPRKKKLKTEPIKKFVAFDEDVQLAADALAMGDTDRLVGANRLAAGMDWEIRYAQAATPQEARARASRQLAQDAAYYDNKMQRNDALRLIKGLDVDLGSGQVREPGYLGLDLYPYDYGTAIFDVANLDLPFPDASVRSFRLVHALQYMPDLAQDATPLLVDIQRCLNYGGQLLYVGLGDLTQKVDMRQIPGLVLVSHEDNQPLDESDTPDNNGLTRQVFERVRVKVPRFYGADPEWLGITEEGADDIALALAAYGAGEEADQALSRLFKSAAGTNADMTMGGGAPIPDAKPYKKIIHAVVYAPNELDYDGEFMEAEQIEEAAHQAFRDGIPIRSEHGPKIGAHLVESYIAPVDMTLTGANGPQFVPKGAWVVAIQFTDEQEWAKVLNGQYRGISVGGRARLEQR